MMSAANEPLVCPFVIAIDTREQRPHTFAGLLADKAQGCRPLIITTQRCTLRQGDYSIVGHEHAVAVERKSPDDLFNTLGQGRRRFERELARLQAACTFAAVVVECDWLTLLNDPPAYSRLNPKTVFRSVIAWQQRYPRVHWWFMNNRRLAEVTTFRVLERFYRNLNAEISNAPGKVPEASRIDPTLTKDCTNGFYDHHHRSDNHNTDNQTRNRGCSNAAADATR